MFGRSNQINQQALTVNWILSGRLTKQYRLEEDLTGLQSRNTLLIQNCHIQAYQKYSSFYFRKTTKKVGLK